MTSRKQPVSVFTLTVSSGASVSNIVHLQGYQPVSIKVPAASDGTHLAFNRGEVEGTLGACYGPTGTLLVASFTDAVSVELDPNYLKNCAYFQIKTCSASNGTAQTQSQDTSFLVVVE